MSAQPGKNTAFVPLLLAHHGAVARAGGDQLKAALLLLYYCNEMRNGGRIPRALLDDVFEVSKLHAVGLRAVLDTDCELFRWEENVLVLTVYPTEFEARAERTRARRASAGRASGVSRARKAKSTTSNTCSTNVQHVFNKCSTNVEQTDRQTSVEFSGYTRENSTDSTPTRSTSATADTPPTPTEPGARVDDEEKQAKEPEEEYLSAEESAAGIQAIINEL